MTASAAPANAVASQSSDPASRTHGFPLPPPGFDPATAAAATLRDFGLPARPAGNDHPRTRAAWMAMFGREMQFIAYKAAATPDELNMDSVSEENESEDGLITVSASRFENSQNWSGVTINANAGRTFQQIWGQWTVPTPLVPAEAPSPARQTEYQCSAWIGFDGQRLYRSSSLPQAGTLHAITIAADGTQTFRTSAWTQWWVRDDTTALPVFLETFPVDHGDVIACVMTILNPHSVLINFVNQSMNPPVVTAIRIDAPNDMPPDGAPMPVAGATANWIMERPSVPNSTRRFDFPDYGTVNFTSCHAVRAFAEFASPVEQALGNARFIRMYEIRSNPQRTSFISMPHRIDDTSFNVTHGGFAPPYRRA